MIAVKAEIPNDLLSDNVYALNRARKKISDEFLKKKAQIIENVYKKYLGGEIKPKDHYRMGIKREVATLTDELYLDGNLLGCIVCEGEKMTYTIKFVPNEGGI